MARHFVLVLKAMHTTIAIMDGLKSRIIELRSQSLGETVTAMPRVASTEFMR